ncbi:DsbA family protein [Halovivax gelatinilyticus]|uniref:DsbA family protein n=1 Tax=Halovivax gelatinilyticus TaxID=2961597 RepID=UPI0020CA5236|nr:thioredoxin domain-containing protein [Halovivax gelatinilyticus]
MSLNNPTRRALVAGSVLAIGGGGAYAISRSRRGDERSWSPGTESSGDTAATFHASNDTSPLGIDLTGKPLLGYPDAPLDIYYWTDFQCPFCKQFERETLPSVIEDHVAPGQVRLVFVPLPYFGPDSMTAAVASRCVWNQTHESDPAAYWHWHEAVIDEQGERNSGWAGADNLLELTQSVDGVDADALDTCLAEQRSIYEDAIDEDAAFAGSVGIDGTPTFTVFDRETHEAGTLVGAQPIERFDQAIEHFEPQ